jgi:hypothetical protein
VTTKQDSDWKNDQNFRLDLIQLAAAVEPHIALRLAQAAQLSRVTEQDSGLL